MDQVAALAARMVPVFNDLQQFIGHDRLDYGDCSISLAGLNKNLSNMVIKDAEAKQMADELDDMDRELKAVTGVLDYIIGAIDDALNAAPSKCDITQ